MSKLNNSNRELNIDELDQVSGGNRSQVNDPWYRGPKAHAPGSIAQGDTLDNTLTFDQLP
jgi:bacteriocin-like protein